jgi:hypothetical protein
MPRKKARSGHTGRTAAGHTRDVKIERIGKVTIYQRGETYHLYYRQGGITQRRKVEGNLAVARTTAHKVMTALDEGCPSPLAYNRTTPEATVKGYLGAVTNVRKLALRTQDRYRAALDRFLDYCQVAGISAIDRIEEVTVETFVQWLRGQKRTRNGPPRAGGTPTRSEVSNSTFRPAGRRSTGRRSTACCRPSGPTLSSCSA